MSDNKMRELISEIVRDVAELPDRNSPEDWPEAMLVTSDELADILADRLAAPKPQPEPVAWLYERPSDSGKHPNRHLKHVRGNYGDGWVETPLYAAPPAPASAEPAGPDVAAVAFVDANGDIIPKRQLTPWSNLYLHSAPAVSSAGAVACKGTDCTAVNGIGHSFACQEEHDRALGAVVSITHTRLEYWRDRLNGYDSRFTPQLVREIESLLAAPAVEDGVGRGGDEEFSTEGVNRLAEKLRREGKPVLARSLLDLAKQRDTLRAALADRDARIAEIDPDRVAAEKEWLTDTGPWSRQRITALEIALKHARSQLAASEARVGELTECLQDWITMRGDKDRTMRVLDAALSQPSKPAAPAATGEQDEH